MQKSAKIADFSLQIVTLGLKNGKITDFKPIITFSERVFKKIALSLHQEKKQNDFGKWRKREASKHLFFIFEILMVKVYG